MANKKDARRRRKQPARRQPVRSRRRPTAADAETVGNLVSDTDVVQRAADRLQDAGFEVLQATSLMINIAGTPGTYEKAFEAKLVGEERPTIKETGRERRPSIPSGRRSPA